MARRSSPTQAVPLGCSRFRPSDAGDDIAGFPRKQRAGHRTFWGYAGRGGTIAMLLLLAVVNRGIADDPSVSDSSTKSIDQPKVNANGWTSSNVCGECHQAIHAVWRQSLHASAWTNGIFQAAYRRCGEKYGAEHAQTCLSCHAPTVRHGGDFDAKEAITKEGVTCDFCHSVSAVDLTDSKDPVRFAVGKTKYGPLRHAQSPAHEVVNSELHVKSEFCASCHEYRNANGVSVLSTYSEWKASPYAKAGKQCQNCHMPLVPARVVALSVKRDSGDVVNLHDISGSHDMDRVRDAIRVDIIGYEWLGERVWVYVQVANEGSGHCFPTGMPMHRAVLEIKLHDGGKLVGRRDIPFEIVMLDKDRRPLSREHDVMVTAASIRSDTRLKPKERRMIDIPFRGIKEKKLALTAKLFYTYLTETVSTRDGEDEFEPVEMKFLIASRQSSMKRLGN